jgi:hypothetical protein
MGLRRDSDGFSLFFLVCVLRWKSLYYNMIVG